MSDRSGQTTVFGGFDRTDRPLGATDVETAVFEGEAVLYHESRRMVHRLNALAGAVWLLCDGETDVESMATELGELFDIDPEGLREGTIDALDQLAVAGLLVGIEPPPTDLRSRQPELVAFDGSRMLVAPPDP